ncbi:MAG: hypothetical protein KDB24_15850, partial [Microthrixaceae bacterium]|nr:hypothetical protein [Microthrixaceae bacterium]
MTEQRSARRSEPTVVGAATLVGRPDDPEAPDAVGWMTDAARAALTEATGAEGSAVTLADHVRWVGVAEGTWRCS